MVGPGYPVVMEGGGAILSATAMDALHVSPACRRALLYLEQTPLATVREMGDMFGPSLWMFSRALNELVDRNFVGRLGLGAVRRNRQRWFIGEDCARIVGPGFGLWHDEWALCQLVDRLPVVEGIYEAAGCIPGLGQMTAFQWFGRAAWDAAAMYENGWAMFVWSGLWQDEERVRRLIERIGRDLVRLSAYGGTAWPAVVCFRRP